MKEKKIQQQEIYTAPYRLCILCVRQKRAMYIVQAYFQPNAFLTFAIRECKRETEIHEWEKNAAYIVITKLQVKRSKYKKKHTMKRIKVNANVYIIQIPCNWHTGI